MLLRKADSLSGLCLSWCFSTAEKDWKMGEERKSKVLPVPSSRGFVKRKKGGGKKTKKRRSHLVTCRRSTVCSRLWCMQTVSDKYRKCCSAAHTRGECMPGNIQQACVNHPGHSSLLCFHKVYNFARRNKLTPHFSKSFVNFPVPLFCVPRTANRAVPLDCSDFKFEISLIYLGKHQSSGLFFTIV